MQQAETDGGQFCFEGFVQLVDAHNRPLFVVLDFRANEIRLTTAFHFTSHVFVHSLVSVLGNNPRRHFLALFGFILDRRDIQIPVKNQRQRSGDRRRAHNESIRSRALLRQRVTLRHAETVLLVTYDKCQIGNFHVVLNNRVRTAHNINLTVFDLRFYLPLFFRRHTASQIRHSIFGEIFLYNCIILRGEHFGRGKIRRAVSALDRHIHRAKRNGGFSAPNVALQKPIHSRGRLQILKNIVDGAFLPVGKFKPKTGGKLPHLGGGNIVTVYARVLFSALDKLKSRNQNEIFFERKPFTRLAHPFHRRRRVNVKIRPCQRRKLIFRHEFRGNNAIDFYFFKRFQNRFPNDRLPDLAFQRIHGHDPFQTVIFIKRLKRRICQSRRAVFIAHAPVKKILSEF